MRAAVPTLEHAVDPVGVGVRHPADGFLHGTAGRDVLILCSTTIHLFQQHTNPAEVP